MRTLSVNEVAEAIGLMAGVLTTLSFLWGVIKTRCLSFVLVIGTGFLLLVSLIMSAFLAAVGKFVLRAVPGPPVILNFVDVAISMPVITLLFAVMFKVLPDGYIAWRGGESSSVAEVGSPST